MNKFRKLLGSETGRAAIPSFIVSLIARFGQLGVAVLVARLLQPAGYGVFTFATGVGLLGSRLAGLGWPILMNRFVPKYTVSKDWSLLRGLVRTADAVTLGAGVLSGLVCIMLAIWLGRESDFYLGLLLGGLLLPVMAFRSLYRNLLAALKVPQRGIMVDELLPAGLMTVFLSGALVLGQGLSPGGVTLLYVLASTMAVVIGGIWIRTLLPREMRSAQPRYMLKAWTVTALPALVGSSARLLMNRADILMLAPLATMVDVGLYGAAMRVTYIQAAPVIVLSTVITARLGEAFAADRVRQGRRLFFGALIFAVTWSVPVALGLSLFDDDVMNLVFGPEYASGASVLSILAVAQIGAALNIPATSFMLMTGRQNTFGKMTVAALLLNVVGNVILIPNYGAIGAALATAGSIFFLTAIQGIACITIIRSGRYSEREHYENLGE